LSELYKGNFQKELSVLSKWEALVLKNEGTISGYLTKIPDKNKNYVKNRFKRLAAVYAICKMQDKAEYIFNELGEKLYYFNKNIMVKTNYFDGIIDENEIKDKINEIFEKTLQHTINIKLTGEPILENSILYSNNNDCSEENILYKIKEFINSASLFNFEIKKFFDYSLRNEKIYLCFYPYKDNWELEDIFFAVSIFRTGKGYSFELSCLWELYPENFEKSLSLVKNQYYNLDNKYPKFKNAKSDVSNNLKDAVVEFRQRKGGSNTDYKIFEDDMEADFYENVSDNQSKDIGIDFD
jgi:hypothetical protein